MKTFEGLMGNMGGGGPQAIPTHHIIEPDKTRPGQMKGSSWKEDTDAIRQQWVEKAQDPFASPRERRHAAQMAAQYDEMIGNEDVRHSALEEMEGDPAGIMEMGRRKRLADEAAAGVENLGVRKSEAAPRGFQRNMPSYIPAPPVYRGK